MKMPTRSQDVTKQSQAMVKKIKGLASSNKQIMLFDWQIEKLEKISTSKKDNTQSHHIKKALTAYLETLGFSAP